MSYAASASDSERLGANCETLYEPNPSGCGHCNGQGYRGRSAAFELIAVDSELQTLIHDGASEQIMERHARTATPSLHDDARRLVLAGQTSLTEYRRVISEA